MLYALCVYIQNSPEINKSFLSFSKTLLVGYTHIHDHTRRETRCVMAKMVYCVEEKQTLYGVLDYEFTANTNRAQCQHNIARKMRHTFHVCGLENSSINFVGNNDFAAKQERRKNQ